MTAGLVEDTVSSTHKDPAAVALGRQESGKARAEKLACEERSANAKKAAASWKKSLITQYSQYILTTVKR